MQLVEARRRAKANTRYGRERKENFPNGPITIHPRVHMRSISKADVKQQNFECDVQMSFEWHDPEYAAYTTTKEFKDREEKDGQQEALIATSWHPAISFQNVEHAESKEVWFWVAGEFVTLNCRIKGTFKHLYFLREYPFHFTDPTVRVSTTYDEQKVHFVRDAERPNKGPDKLSLRGFILEEWALQPMMQVLRKTSAAEDSVTGLRYDEVRAQIILRYRPEFTLWHVVLMELSLVVVALSLLTVPVKFGQDRMSWHLTILLAGVAFKLVVAEKLPATPYLTLLHNCALRGGGRTRAIPHAPLASCSRLAPPPSACCVTLGERRRRRSLARERRHGLLLLRPHPRHAHHGARRFGAEHQDREGRPHHALDLCVPWILRPQVD